MAKKHVKTKTDLAEHLGMTVQNLYATWLGKDGFPEEGRYGWNIEACIKFVKDAKDSQADGEGDPDKRRKLRAEADILEERLKRMRGESMDIQDHYDILSESARITLDFLREFEQWVSVEYRDPKLTKKAGELATRGKRWLLERVKE